MKRLTARIHQRLRLAGHTGGGEATATAPAPPGPEQERVRAGRIQERDAQEVRVLAAEVEHLARQRCGADAAAPAPGASTASLLTAARDALQAALPATPGAAADARPKATVAALVNIRDDLLAAIRHGGDGAAMARWAYDQLGGVLELEGVEPVEDLGPFDPRYQEALETTQTDDPAQDRTIAATIRPGYASSGRLIRAQEVVVYALRGEAPHTARPLRPGTGSDQ